MELEMRGIPDAIYSNSEARYYTRNSAIADKPRDAFVQMQWRGWPNQRH